VALRACLRYINSLRRLDHAISFYFIRAYEEFGSPGSSLSCDESVLCCTWLPGVECVDASN
jgi:hypothetical protein